MFLLRLLIRLIVFIGGQSYVPDMAVQFSQRRAARQIYTCIRRKWTDRHVPFYSTNERQQAAAR